MIEISNKNKITYNIDNNDGHHQLCRYLVEKFIFSYTSNSNS